MRNIALILLIITCTMYPGKAQKLPNIQEANLRAPIGIKIDGRAKEWKDSLHAYNKATQVYYTISNDDENLYLTVKADKPRVITKIIDVGITFIVNKGGKKGSEAKENMSVTYPMLDFAPGQQILWYAGSRVRSEVAVPAFLQEHDTTRYSNQHVDSLIAIANTLLGNHAKNIDVRGIPGIKDTLLSVYNEERIRTVARFGNDGVYTYELAIPLKYLGLDVNVPQKFSYSVHLENRLTHPKRGMRSTYIYPNGIVTDIDQDLDSTTDFWAYYTLAGK